MVNLSYGKAYLHILGLCCGGAGGWGGVAESHSVRGWPQTLSDPLALVCHMQTLLA